MSTTPEQLDSLIKESQDHTLLTLPPTLRGFQGRETLVLPFHGRPTSASSHDTAIHVAHRCPPPSNKGLSSSRNTRSLVVSSASLPCASRPISPSTSLISQQLSLSPSVVITPKPQCPLARRRHRRRRWPLMFGNLYHRPCLKSEYKGHYPSSIDLFPRPTFVRQATSDGQDARNQAKA